MITCKEASKLISQSLDESLSKRERLKLKFHLLLCTACCRFQRQVKWLRIGVKRLTLGKETDADVKLSPEAKARIHATLQDHNKHRDS